MAITMVKVCCVDRCTSSSLKCIESFFSFPMKKDLFKEWKKIVPTKRYITKHSRICSKHFKDSCYQHIGKRRILKQNAIPTIFDLESISPFMDQYKNLKTLQPSIIPNISQSSLKMVDKETSHTTEETNKILQEKYVAMSPQTSKMEKTMIEKKDAAVETSPQRVGPTKKENILRKKIKLLHARLRRKEMQLSKVSELLKLKNRR